MGDPCTRQPDPCADFPNRPKCVAIHAKCHAVKCVGPAKTQISLKFDDPNLHDHLDNDVDLLLVPTTSDGNFCEDDHLLEPGNDACGVMMGNNEVSDNDQKRKKLLLPTPASSPMQSWLKLRTNTTTI